MSFMRCAVAMVFTHMHFPPAVRHAFHACDLLFSIACQRGPRSSGSEHRGSVTRFPYRAEDACRAWILSRDSLCSRGAQIGAGYECLVQEIAQLRFYGCARISSNEYEYVCMHALGLTALWLSRIVCISELECRPIEQS